MDQSSSRLQYLFQRHKSGEATPAEHLALMEMIRDSSYEDILKKLIADEIEAAEQTKTEAERTGIAAEMGSTVSEERAAQIFAGIIRSGKGSPLVQRDQAPVLPIRQASQYTKRKWAWRAAAAIFILAAGTAVYWSLNTSNKREHPVALQQPAQQDVAPGTHAAILTLANGRQIVLDSTAKGTISRQGSTTIINLKGQLAYNSDHSPRNADHAPLYNTLTTQRGNQYQLILPDGSRVWLNAASSIRFPLNFSDKERNVDITGEAYFEVAHQAGIPFRVHYKDVSVNVLGTHFNVNTYIDETAITTTLLEGSVSVTSRQNNQLLKPGQAAQVDHSGALKVINDVNLDQAVAWKNEIFYFRGADIETIMRQLSRWYDIAVQYDTNEPNDHTQERFYAKIPRNAPISEVLKALSLTGKAHFQIDGKKIIVMP